MLRLRHWRRRAHWIPTCDTSSFSTLRSLLNWNNAPMNRDMTGWPHRELVLIVNWVTRWVLNFDDGRLFALPLPFPLLALPLPLPLPIPIPLPLLALLPLPLALFPLSLALPLREGDGEA